MDPAKGTTIEEHIQGDIAFAFVQHWDATHDLEWLTQSGFPVLEGIAQFWASKVVSNADGSYSIPDIMGPDEYHGNVTDSVYCNAVAQLSLNAAYTLASHVGAVQNSTFKHIADNLVILFDSETRHHPEFSGYTNATVKQADVILLGYPLNFSMPRDVRKNDLTFYAPLTNPKGPAMTWSMFTVGFLDVGDAPTAEDYFYRSYENNINAPYYWWSEVPGGGGAKNFITGAGGFLQCVWAGYGGVRVGASGLRVVTPRPLPHSERLVLRGVALLNTSMIILVSADAYTVALDGVRTATPLQVIVDGTSTPRPLLMGVTMSFASNQSITITAK